MAEGGEGEGPELYPYGEYEGDRDDNLDRHGWGSALLPNGDVYEGNYWHGLRMGKGMYCFRNGARYDGDWRKGKKQGHGQFIYPDGSRYIGQWRKDNKHGQGSYSYVNGDTYEGAWWKNFRHGLGTYTFKKDNVAIYGVWKNGRLEGSGIITYPCYKYHGKFDKNLPKGPGCFTFENKWMQHGYYLNVRDPAFDYVGVDELAEPQEPAEPGVIDNEYRGNPPGIVPIWRSRLVTSYNPDLLPLEPVAVPVKDSVDSLLDIMDYLHAQYAVGGGGEEEGDERLLPPPPAEGENAPM